jgi:L-threonylcarbamoyladenylate synthase
MSFADRNACPVPAHSACDNGYVQTFRLVVDPGQPDSAESRSAIDAAARILRSGGLVALPTETVYGLGANALDAAAVAKVFAAKQRPAWDPIIVHVSDQAMLGTVVAEISEHARGLMAAFWPGPLTLLLPRSAAVPDSVTAGRPLVGIRMPAHPVALELIRLAGVPIAAPSANRFGHTSPTTAAHVLADLDGRMDAVLDAGPTAHGVESTVLDPNQTPMVIYRPGAVTAEQIGAVAGPVRFYRPAETTGAGERVSAGETTAEAMSDSRREALPSPGVGLRHYAPKARLVLVEGSVPELGARLAQAVRTMTAERVGVMLPAGIEAPVLAGAAVVHAWGNWAAPEEMARELYAALRELDALGCSVIVCPVPAGEGIGAAIRDRLFKAAKR